jgi:hypothetical protein
MWLSIVGNNLQFQSPRAVSPSFSLTPKESSTECDDEKCEGNNTESTLSFPNACTAKYNTSAESTPPLKPNTAFVKPNFAK